jgi:uncharacterized membrane-anchored protein
MTKKRGWIIAAALQVLFLLFMAVSYYSIDYFGKEIKIKTVPVDPRDLLYGDYVTLRFEISEAPLSKWKGDSALLERGQLPVYVVLEENKDGYYHIQHIYPQKPDISGSQVLLKAKAEKFWDEAAENIQLTYGIERYYIQENTGKDLEAQASDMDVIISIAPWGAYKIADLQP